MTSISDQPLLDFGSSLGLPQEAWKQEELQKLKVREIPVRITEKEKVKTSFTVLLDSYGPALTEVTLRFGDWLKKPEEDEERKPLEKKEFPLVQDPTKLDEFLNDEALGKVEILLTLTIDKDQLIKDWLRQQGQIIPPGVEPRLVFFRAALEGLFQSSIEKIAAWWSPGASRLVVLCPEWQGFLNGPYLAVVGGGDPIAAWHRVVPGPLPEKGKDKSDELSPKDLHEARAKSLTWPKGWLPAITPLHLAVTGDDNPTADVVANFIHVHTINLCILYTANRIEPKRKDVRTSGPPILDWRAWDSIFLGQCTEAQVASAPVVRLLGKAGALAAHDLTELVKWCYGKGFSGDKLSFFQGAVARLLKERDPRQATFDTLVQEAPNLWRQIEPNWKMFVEGKLDDFGEQVRALEDYVAATVQAFSDQISGLIKGLSETMLAAVAVLLGAFIATLLSKDTTPAILAISVYVYLLYLLVFPLLYNMCERWQSYTALVRQFEERRKRFNTSLSPAKVNSIVGAHVDRSQTRFRRWFWWIVATYLAVALVLCCLLAVALVLWYLAASRP